MSWILPIAEKWPWNIERTPMTDFEKMMEQFPEIKRANENFKKMSELEKNTLHGVSTKQYEESDKIKTIWRVNVPGHTKQTLSIEHEKDEKNNNLYINGEKLQNDFTNSITHYCLNLDRSILDENSFKVENGILTFETYIPLNKKPIKKKIVL